MTDKASTSQSRMGLGSIARPDGTLAIIAMDQRNTLRRMLEAVNRPTTTEEMREFKVDVAAGLSPLASAVLLDPEFGVPAVKEANAMASGCAYLVAAEPPERET
jgi:tagatose-1,6-bisphosphate aldolase